jgi:hypothetical protein
VQRLDSYEGPTLGVKLAVKNERSFTAQQLAEARTMPTRLGRDQAAAAKAAGGPGLVSAPRQVSTGVVGWGPPSSSVSEVISEVISGSPSPPVHVVSAGHVVSPSVIISLEPPSSPQTAAPGTIQKLHGHEGSLSVEAADVTKQSFEQKRAAFERSMEPS